MTVPDNACRLYSLAINDRGIGFEQRKLLGESPIVVTPEALDHGFLGVPLVYSKDCREVAGAK